MLLLVHRTFPWLAAKDDATGPEGEALRGEQLLEAAIFGLPFCPFAGRTCSISLTNGETLDVSFNRRNEETSLPGERLDLVESDFFVKKFKFFEIVRNGQSICSQEVEDVAKHFAVSVYEVVLRQ